MSGTELDHFSTFGELLRHLRQRARLTQRELGLAVGYSDAHITRLESGQRLPDPSAVRARFIDALDLQREPALAQRLLKLADQAHGTSDDEVPPRATPHTPFPTELPTPLTHFAGRDHLVHIIAALRDEGGLTTLDEANALLAAAGQPALYEGSPTERALVQQLTPSNGSMVVRPTARYVPPAPLTALIGREHEVEQVGQLLGTARLVTLTGAGGSGKTRLAIEVARHLVDHYPNGVCFVPLAAVSHAEGVAPAIVQALSVREDPAKTPLDNLCHFLAGKGLLLVLDNYEHVLEAATLVPEVLMAAPGLVVLATSREVLRVSGEHEVPVNPLPVLTIKGHPTVEQLAQNSAAQLFVARARAAQPRFRLTDANAPAVAELCRRADGLPLAIELAAARMRQFTPQALLGRMGLQVLTGGPHDLPARQRTLHATIEWSYRLLNAEEQFWLRHLAVFVSGAEVEQIAAVGDRRLDTQRGDSTIQGLQISDLELLISNLQSLVDKHLVRADIQPDGTTRYSLLELIREYALERLHECGDYAAVQRRYTEAFAALAEQSVQPIRSHGQLFWRDRLEHDYANLNAVLMWSFSPAGDTLIGCRMVGALSDFWNIASMHVREAQHWARVALATMTSDVPAKIRADVFLCAVAVGVPTSAPEFLEMSQQALALCRLAEAHKGIAVATFFVGKALCFQDSLTRIQEGFALLQESLTLARSIGDELTAVRATQSLAAYAREQTHDLVLSEKLRREAVSMSRVIGNLIETSVSLCYLAYQLMQLMQFREGLESAEEALSQAHRIGNPEVEVWARWLIAENTRLLGDPHTAVQILENCLTFAQELGLGQSITILPRIYLSRAVNDTGDHARARTLLCELSRSMQGDPYAEILYGDVLDTLALVACTSGDTTRAAWLWGAADALFEAHPWYERIALEHEFLPQRARAREQLGESVFEAAYTDGRAIPQQAIEYALQVGEANEPPIR